MSEQTGNTQLSPQEREKNGQALREQTPLESHGDWKPADDRPDPLSLLQAQDKGRIQYLLPIKYGRMVASPFTFLRGSAVVMASDLLEGDTEQDHQTLVDAINDGKIIAQTGV